MTLWQPPAAAEPPIWEIPAAAELLIWEILAAALPPIRKNPGSSAASDTERSKVYYVVRRGRKPGIYRTYEECEKQVSGFSHQEYKKFSSREAAEEYMQEKENKAWAFVLGDYNSDTGVYGYGGFLCDGERDYPLSGCANDPDIRTMRADAGKLLGIMAAVRKAEELGIQELTIRYDLTGIEKMGNRRVEGRQTGYESLCRIYEFR